MDDKQRIALVETATLGAESAGELGEPVIRYQLGNHLGSASLELDRDGELISYEEYHPYGTAAFQAGRSSAEISLKRYRYTGKERDEETGFNYHGVRYYAVWLGRWVSCDPIGIRGGLNVYEYGYDSPTLLEDPSGEHPPPRQELGARQQTRLGQFVERVRAGRRGGRTCSPTSPALETMQQILGETAQHYGAIQFGGWIRSGPRELGDTGFRPALQDPWVQSRYQVGHFLTAVGHALNGIDSRLRAGIAGSQLMRASPLGGAYEWAARLVGHRIPETRLSELDIGPGALGTVLGSYWSDAFDVDMQSRAYAIWVTWVMKLALMLRGLPSKWALLPNAIFKPFKRR
jgi:RHS repeat-associated protein